MPDHPHTESGKPKVRVNVMIDPDLKALAESQGRGVFSRALEVGLKIILEENKE